MTLFGEAVDKRRGAAADVDDRRIERRRQQLDQLERRRGREFEPADTRLAAGPVGGVPVELTTSSRQALVHGGEEYPSA